MPLLPPARLADTFAMNATSESAEEVSEAIMEMVSPFAVDLLLPSFLSGLAVKAMDCSILKHESA